ncbi:MAG: hypothetical protein LBU65_08715 [Planctomycetaceae bacterium]|jgi:hypothetical protein|nr:hypothetical protein [Planctomycetaceae bacterium]
MKTYQNIFVLLFAIVLLFNIYGCSNDSKRPADLPVLYQCQLTFTQEGKPLDGAEITLSPVEPSRWAIGGVTDKDGIVSIRTNGSYAGIPEGRYKILVAKTIVENKNYLSVVEPVFQQEKDTPLEIVISKGNNNKMFDVGKPVKIVTGQVKDEPLSEKRDE